MGKTLVSHFLKDGTDITQDKVYQKIQAAILHGTGEEIASMHSGDHTIRWIALADHHVAGCTRCFIYLGTDPVPIAEGDAIWNGTDFNDPIYAMTLSMKRALLKTTLGHKVKSHLWTTFNDKDGFGGMRMKKVRVDRSEKIPSNIEGRYFRHTKSGNDYVVTSTDIKLKNSKGQWVKGIEYEDAKHSLYGRFVRTREDFLNKFKLLP